MLPTDYWTDHSICHHCKLPTVDDDEIALSMSIPVGLAAWERRQLTQTRPRLSGTCIELYVQYCTKCGHPALRWSLHEFRGWDQGVPIETNAIAGPPVPIDVGLPAPPFHDEVPGVVRQSIEDACRVATLSPNATALLCRRALQAALRSIDGVSPNTSIAAEIRSAASVLDLDAETTAAMKQISQLGAVAAHPSSSGECSSDWIDVDEHEATRLLALTWNVVLRIFPPDDGSAALLEQLRPSVERKHRPPRRSKPD